MDRRDAVRLLGATVIPAVADLSPDKLFALARDAHGRAAHARRAGLLDEHQRATIDTIAELIIPATDTPGARAAGVAALIEIIVAEWYRDAERAAFLRGLSDVDSRSQADFAKPFIELAEPQQTAILTGLEAEARAMPRGSPTPFFSRIKDLTLFGYYTSEIGVRQELGVVFMPGRYDGAAPVRGH
jgi:Gluconate 2-dehydrogenase subunit 3